MIRTPDFRTAAVAASTLLALGMHASAHAQTTVPPAPGPATAAKHYPTVDALRAGFLNPPANVRPMVRWWWFGPAVNKPELLRELQRMQHDGVGGAELAFVYPLTLDDPAKGVKNLAFVSPAMLDMVNYAQSEGRRLGLRIDVTLCSGWPYGGPHIPLSLAAGRLRTLEVPVPARASSVNIPKLPAEGDVLVSASLADGAPRHWSSAHTEPLTLTPGAKSVTFAPAGIARVALFFIGSHTRQQVKRAAVGAEGYVLDPFSHDAVAAHIHAVGEPLLSAFGSTPPYAIFSDSLEAYGADWTPDLPAQFKARRGYDILPCLPEFVAGDTPAAQRLRHDYGRTLTELINENYLVQLNDFAKSHGTRFRSQTYGEPAVSFSSQHLVGLTEGEGPQWRQFSTLRWASSANHVFGNEVTSGETFTWLHSPVFRATPLDMKTEADVDFLTGENQVSFHGWPYSPPPSELPAGDPGWSLYAAAALNDHNPWHPVMPAVTDYIARISYLLRQGQPANQVAILLPTDDAWAGFSPAKVTVTGAMSKLIAPELMNAILAAGYNVDFIDADAIRTAGLGTHQIVVLPPTDRIPVDTLRALDTFTAQKGKVIAVAKLPTLDAESNPLPTDPNLLAPIALIPSTHELAQALHNAAAPDFALTSADQHTHEVLGFIRRKLPDADIYFVANTGNTPLHTPAHFSTRFANYTVLDPDTGKETASGPAQTAVDLTLAPYESRVLIFSNTNSAAAHKTTAQSHELLALSDDWHVSFPALHKDVTEHTLREWSAMDPALLHYSGAAVYTRDFTLDHIPHSTIELAVDGGKAIPGAPNSTPAEGPLPGVAGPDGLPNPQITRTGPGMHAWFDPPVREGALVLINGKPAGALWHPPYRLDITPLLKPGINHIEIDVFNTALNAWSAIPPHDYTALKAKYGDRFQMQDLDQVKPLPSGILGSISLVTEDLP